MRQIILGVLLLSACGSLDGVTGLFDSPVPDAEAADKPAFDNAALTQKVQALETELAAIKARLDAVEAGEPAPEKWLYDGNGVKRFRVVDQSLWGATVDVGDGRLLGYPLRTVQGPNVYKSAPAASFYYTTADCTGTPHNVGVDYRGRIIFSGDDVYYVAQNASAVERSSYYLKGSGVCYEYKTAVTLTPLTKDTSLTRSDFELKLPLEVR